MPMTTNPTRALIRMLSDACETAHQNWLRERAKLHAYQRASIHTLRRERWWLGVSLALSVCFAIATGYVWVPVLCVAAFAVLEVQARRDVRAIEETEE